MKFSLSRLWSHSEGGLARFMEILNAAATFMSFLMILLVMGDVLGRGIFDHPIIGTPEIVQNLIVAIAFLQIAHVLRVDRHIKSTFFVDRLSPLPLALANIMTSGVGLTLFVMLFIGGWDLNWVAWKVHEYEGEGSLNVPTYPVRSIILLGSALMSIQFLLNLYRSTRAAMGHVFSRRAG